MVQSLGSLLAIASLAVSSANGVVYSPRGGKPVIERPYIKSNGLSAQEGLTPPLNTLGLRQQ
jgi:hypothetical protein